MDAATVSQFLVETAQKSDRPRGVLNSTLAAFSSYFQASDVKVNPINQEVYRLIDGLVKCETKKPMTRTKVMPREPFIRLFKSWGHNENLSLWALHLKALTFGLSVMIRPFDVAPKSVQATVDDFVPNEFKRSNLEFREKDLVIYLFGIKNDYNRDGFRVVLPRSEDSMICPVGTLYDYVKRTQDKVRKLDGSMFLSLLKPYNGLSAGGVASVLNKAIDMASLGRQGYSAKCFRPSGATAAIEAGMDPNIVRTVGRWRNAETFEKHYVHARTPAVFTDAVLGIVS